MKKKYNKIIYLWFERAKVVLDNFKITDKLIMILHD